MNMDVMSIKIQKIGMFKTFKYVFSMFWRAQVSNFARKFKKYKIQFPRR